MSLPSNRASQLIPGIMLLFALGMIAVLVGGAIPAIDELLLSVFIGLILGNTCGIPSIAKPGVQLHSLALKTGIVLLGTQIAFSQLLSGGFTIIGLALGTVLFGILFTEFLTRMVFGLKATTGSLLAAGSTICGVSAVVAVAESIDADESEIAYVAGAILLFDVVTLILYPAASSLVDISAKGFGIWAGLSMFSTGPVTVAGFAHSNIAGQWATLTKLVRNSLIGGLSVVYTLHYSRADKPGSIYYQAQNMWSQFPKFLVGFILAGVIANTELIPNQVVASVDTIINWLFIIAFVGLGSGIDLTEIRRVGVQPLFVVGAYLITIGSATLVAVLYMFP